MSAEQQELWCLVELFGHKSIAGRVTEDVIGGCKLLRVDVPEAGGKPAFTRYFGAAAIYGITPTSEEDARRLAAHCRPGPDAFFLLNGPPSLPAPSFDLEPDEFEDDLRVLDPDGPEMQF